MVVPCSGKNTEISACLTVARLKSCFKTHLNCYFCAKLGFSCWGFSSEGRIKPLQARNILVVEVSTEMTQRRLCLAEFGSIMRQTDSMIR